MVYFFCRSQVMRPLVRYATRKNRQGLLAADANARPCRAHTQHSAHLLQLRSRERETNSLSETQRGCVPYLYPSTIPILSLSLSLHLQQAKRCCSRSLSFSLSPHRTIFRLPAFAFSRCSRSARVVEALRDIQQQPSASAECTYCTKT